MIDRLEIVGDLLAFSKPLNVLSEKLNMFCWDYEECPATLNSQHMVNILNRYLDGELVDTDLEQWADLVEGREDIVYEEANEEKIEHIINILANPLTNGEITKDICRSYIECFNLLNQD